MSESTRTRVMIIDDHPVVRAGLHSLVADQSDMEVVAEAATASQARREYERVRPEVTLVDLSLPDMEGAELIRLLRCLDPAGRFVVLTALAGEQDVVHALRAGAQAYLLKDAPGPELLLAIRTVRDGGRYVPHALGSKAMARMFDSSLTGREFEVLRLITRGLSNREVADNLGITEETVKTYVRNILGKLGVESRTKAIALSLKRGIVHFRDL